MAFEELEFTKEWTDPAAFPTYEENESQVRADMQCLYDEIRDFLNSKLIGVLNTEGAASILLSTGETVDAVVTELVEKVESFFGENATLANDLSMGGYRLTNLANPTDEGDAVSKGYLTTLLSTVGASSVSVSDTAPENTLVIWVDTTDSGRAKYYDGTGWVYVVAVSGLAVSDDGEGNVTLSAGV